KALGFPVDIEFACDGDIHKLYLLQCRPQSQAGSGAAVAVPKNVAATDQVFSASRFITNGLLKGIEYVVYVDPDEYDSLPTMEDLAQVGRIVGEQNTKLPRQKFILMGPGRWGSRGDIKLGVSVTYSDINNTAVLMEIAAKKGNYTPDLSFGTHFFQDLVESSIRYLPLYPDDDGVVFNEAFFTRAPNALAALAPEFAALGEVLRVVDVPAAARGRILRVLMNGELDEAVGFLADPAAAGEAQRLPSVVTELPGEDHWRWRLRMAQRIAAALDSSRFGVKAAYVFGSTKNGTAGPASDIDLLLHVEADEARRHDLELWLSGWSESLAEANYLRTGYRTEGLLDVHCVTDEDIARGDSYASKIGAVTDAARPLPMGADAAQT
ncbi:MAG TPA: nucleotidyltransferase domain-containing protein, partial [Vicinamibacteria bacterium]|nr:nucleotidyltransferase domain-containing protein [Vicinamibacteria bacterium]